MANMTTRGRIRRATYKLDTLSGELFETAERIETIMQELPKAKRDNGKGVMVRQSLETCLDLAGQLDDLIVVIRRAAQ